jgi:hypothetical protein
LASILLDDYLRYFLLGEEKPHYKIFWQNCNNLKLYNL